MLISSQCFGPPPSQSTAGPDSERAPASAGRRATRAEEQEEYPPMVRSAPRAPSADRHAAAASTSPLHESDPRREQRRHTSANASISPSHAHASPQARRTVASMPRARPIQPLMNEEEPFDRSDEQFSSVIHNDQPDDSVGESVRTSVIGESFDGRFAAVEFGAQSPVSRSAGRAAQSTSASISARAPRRTAAVPSRQSTTGHSLDDSEKSRDQLLSALADERARHHATALQLQTINGMYQQLLTEQGEEKLGTRRVTLLKAQNMQMERQVII
jgi:hypothetical protein